ncbi:hypothetical protein BKA66DRAFT_435526, partial [Pyrenochaeta sp. MPI-SDFR-AT-0127]
INRSRSMRVILNLPLALAPEIYVAAVYLLNYTLTRKTLFKIAYNKKPLLTHLKLYSCRVYILRT